MLARAARSLAALDYWTALAARARLRHGLRGSDSADSKSRLVSRPRTRSDVGYRDLQASASVTAQA